MSKEVYTMQLNTMSNQLKYAKTERVRAVILQQMAQLQMKLREIESQPSREYLAQLEAKYSNTEEKLSTDEPKTRGRKKKDAE